MTDLNGRRGPARTTRRETRARLPSRPATWLRAEIPSSPGAIAVIVIRVISVAGLGIDAYVHLDLASTYSETGGLVSEGMLFRAEAGLAFLAAVALVLSARRLSFLYGFAVAASALTVMLVSRYAELGSFGPFPDLDDPVWFPEKLWAAAGEAAATVASLAGILLLGVLAGPRSAGRVPDAPGHRGGRFPPRW